MTTLRKIYEEVCAEDDSAALPDNQALALRRYAERVMGVTDPDVLHDFFNEAYDLLIDGTPFDK